MRTTNVDPVVSSRPSPFLSLDLIGGHCDAAFEDVKRAFTENFERGEIGAACTVAIGGHTVVDLWGGWADEDRRHAWQEDTLVNAYSVGKPIVALSVLQLVASGDFQLDEPASRLWPELIAGQHGATVRDLLCHRAGVPAIRRPLTNDALWDWDEMSGAVAETEPWWTPGSKHAYHVNTYGYLAGELSRRVTGRLPGRWLQEEVAGPLEADLAWGLTHAQRARCADIVWEPNVMAHVWPDTTELTDEQRMLVLGYTNPPGISSLGVVNSEAWRTTQVPSTNLHATARGISRLYSALSAGGSIDGITVLDGDILREATKPQSEGWCPYLEREVTFGLGFQPTRPDRPFGPNPGSFGHFGTGGSVGFADPSASLAFGYVMNAVRPRWQNSRNRALVDALYSCID